MSSIVNPGVGCEGKLLIHIAENGHSFELDCDGSTIVEAVQGFLQTMAGIQLNDQLLLCGDLKLESHERLETYKLPSDELQVFCFNKARLQANAMPPHPEHIDIHDIPEPPLPKQDPHPLDNAMDPALKALPSYEPQFRYHYHCGHAIYSKTLRKFEVCKKFLREQNVQERALEIARHNLDHFFRILNQNYMDFVKCYSQQHRIHSDLLANFTRDIEKLRSCKLIPALQTSTRKCLLDLVKEENLRKWVENCTCSHKQFENKVSQFKHVFRKLKHDVDELFSSNASLPIRDLESMIKEHYRHINEQRSIMQSLSKDVSTVKKLVDDCLDTQLSSSLRPHDAVSALGPMYEVHDKNHLPKMRGCDHSISDLLDFCSTKKNEMNIFVHNYMQKIAYIQHMIKDVRLQFNAFSEAIKRQDGVFEGLKVVNGIGPAYRACLAEVVRRKASMKLYMGMAGQLAEKLAVKREDEVRRREEFLKAQGPYIPRDLLASMGLFDTPSQCDVNIVPFDTNLLDINIEHIDRYAPPSLVGFPFQSDKQGTSRTSCLSEIEGDVATDEKSESRELDYGQLMEIAGTSKIEVENAKLRAELASAIAIICSFSPEIEYASLDDTELDNLVKDTTKKTAEALQHKDEYIKHLESMLKDKQLQCQSYEKRIGELAQQLSDQYLWAGKCFGDNDTPYSGKEDDGGSEICRPTEIMDEISCTSDQVDVKDGILTRVSGKSQEVENMSDSSGTMNPNLDSSMVDPQRDEQQVEEKDEDKMLGQLVGMKPHDASLVNTLDVSSSEAPGNMSEGNKDDLDILLELQSALEDKGNQLTETESRLKSALEEMSKLALELENCRKLLDESQMNCAHLENCLHEVRQEAQTHLCAADRRASEYNNLRASAVKMRGLFERLRSCINAAGGVTVFVESLRSLAQSLASSASDGEDDGVADFRVCIKVLADKVCVLSRLRAELLERYSKVEATNKQLTKELEARKELVKTLYSKLQLEKQANKEKISFCRIEMHEIAAFVLNSSGHYEAINRNCPNYYLSSESVALFTEHLPIRPSYIVGQIVHIEQQVVKTDLSDMSTSSSSETTTLSHRAFKPGSGSNSFGLPVGCEYFIVTVAMLPDTTIRPPPPS